MELYEQKLRLLLAQTNDRVTKCVTKLEGLPVGEFALANCYVEAEGRVCSRSALVRRRPDEDLEVLCDRAMDKAQYAAIVEVTRCYIADAAVAAQAPAIQETPRQQPTGKETVEDDSPPLENPPPEEEEARLPTSLHWALCGELHAKDKDFSLPKDPDAHTVEAAINVAIETVQREMAAPKGKRAPARNGVEDQRLTNAFAYFVRQGVRLVTIPVDQLSPAAVNTLVGHFKDATTAANPGKTSAKK